MSAMYLAETSGGGKVAINLLQVAMIEPAENGRDSIMLVQGNRVRAKESVEEMARKVDRALLEMRPYPNCAGNV